MCPPILTSTQLLVESNKDSACINYFKKNRKQLRIKHYDCIKEILAYILLWQAISGIFRFFKVFRIFFNFLLKKNILLNKKN